MMEFETHPTLEQLGDLLDEWLSLQERRALEEHLNLCARCAQQWARLEVLLVEARGLPDAIEPPAELWQAVEARIRRPQAARPTRRNWLLAAAAVLLVALSSGITALVVRRPQIVVVRQEAPPVASTTLTLPPPARSVDADYAATIRELNETLAQHRSQLDPATIAKVEASLHVIDLAIGEARHALASDPANLMLLDILAANYERKLELLRRANELLPST